jgi:hypothetical protein
MKIDQETIIELKALIDCDLSVYPHERFNNLYQTLEWTTFDMALLVPGDVIIRARVNDNTESFTDVRDISFRPQYLNHKYQRASTPNSTMFYGCMIPHNHTKNDFDNALLATLFEVLDVYGYSVTDILVRKKVTFGFWKVKAHIPLAIIMTPDEYYSGKSQCNFYESRTWLIMPDEKELRAMNIISHFLKYHFTKHVKHDYEYIPSAVFSEYVTSRGCSGIYYPGIKSEYSTYSVALSPDAVSKGLELEFVYESNAYTKRSSYIIETTHTAVPVKNKLAYNKRNSDKFKTEKEIEDLLDNN